MRRCGPIAVKDQVSYSMRHLDELRGLEADLRKPPGFDRADLEGELDADLAAGRG